MPAGTAHRRTCAVEPGRSAVQLFGVALDPSVAELKAVAPILAGGELIATCTFVTSGPRTVGVASTERLRAHQGAPFVVGTQLDGSATIPVASWSMSFSGVAIVQIAEPLTGDVAPLQVGSVCATVNTHGAPAAIVAVERAGSGWKRVVVPVDVDLVDGGGMSDVITRLASPRTSVTLDADGGALFAQFPANPALGRPRETVLVALGVTYRNPLFKPRALPPLVELVGLDELGRALAFAAPTPETRDAVVAGEIADRKS
jgi:hypothetical protein